MAKVSGPRNGASKIAFRFFFLYFFLFTLPVPLNFFPGIDRIVQYCYKFWEIFVPWFGAHILQIEYPIRTLFNGSGDTTYHYVRLLAIVIFAVIGCIFWSILDRKRTGYDKALYWLTVCVRYYLAFVMINYGFAKVFKTQFPFPYFDQLTNSYGESTPMGLLWTFMGYSTAYNLFAGLCEVLGGFLLFFKRTTTFGSLLLIAIMSNVVVLNFAYDVPVKITSCHLLVMAIFLAALDGKRVADFLFNRPALAKPDEVTLNGRQNFLRISLKFLLIGFLFLIQLVKGVEHQTIIKSPLYGLYSVRQFIYNGDTLADNDLSKWKSIAIDEFGFTTAKFIDDRVWQFTAKLDSTKRTLSLKNGEILYSLKYRKLDNGHFNFWGVKGSDSVYIFLERKKLPLLDQKFRWINEYPDNR